MTSPMFPTKTVMCPVVSSFSVLATTCHATPSTDPRTSRPFNAAKAALQNIAPRPGQFLSIGTTIHKEAVF